MSGALGFVTANSAMRGFDAMDQRLERRRRADEARATDAAIRAGVAEMANRPAAEPAAAPAAGLGAVTATPVSMPAPQPRQAAAPAGGDDDDLVARVLFGEAGGEGEQGMTAAMHVIANRARLTGMTPRQVVEQRGQFEAWGNPQARARLMSAPPEQIAAARAIVDRVMRGELPDPTGGATHFLNPDMQRNLGRPQPAWAPEGQGTRIGRHVFYARPGDFRQGQAANPEPTTPPMPPMPAAAPAAPQRAPLAAPGNPYMPVLQRLAGTPGGGAAALQLLRAGESEASRRMLAQARAQGRQTDTSARDQMQAERNIIYALGRGEVAFAQQLAQRHGIPLPREIVENREAQQLFARGSNIATRHYRNDPAQGQRFLQAFLQSGGNIDRAFQAAGVPAGAPPTWRLEMLRQDDKDFLAFVNPRTREIVPAQVGQQPPGGALPTERPPAAGTTQAAAEPAPGPVTRAPRSGGSTAKPSNIEERRRILEAAGYDPATAARIAAGGFITENQRAQAWIRLRQQIEQSEIEMDPQRRAAAIQRRLQAAQRDFDAQFPPMPQPAPRAPNTAAAATTQGQGTPPPPAPAVPPPRPASVPRGSQWSPSRQQWRDTSGTLYDQYGNRL